MQLTFLPRDFFEAISLWLTTWEAGKQHCITDERRSKVDTERYGVQRGDQSGSVRRVYRISSMSHRSDRPLCI